MGCNGENSGEKRLNKEEAYFEGDPCCSFSPVWLTNTARSCSLSSFHMLTVIALTFCCRNTSVLRFISSCINLCQMLLGSLMSGWSIILFNKKPPASAALLCGRLLHRDRRCSISWSNTITWAYDGKQKMSLCSLIVPDIWILEITQPINIRHTWWNKGNESFFIPVVSKPVLWRVGMVSLPTHYWWFH